LIKRYVKSKAGRIIPIDIRKSNAGRAYGKCSAPKLVISPLNQTLFGWYDMPSLPFRVSGSSRVRDILTHCA